MVKDGDVTQAQPIRVFPGTLTGTLRKERFPVPEAVGLDRWGAAGGEATREVSKARDLSAELLPRTPSQMTSSKGNREHLLTDRLED